MAIREQLIEYALLKEIDIHFADYICELADHSATEELWLLTALLSYVSHRGDSALDLTTVNGHSLQEFFAIVPPDSGINGWNEEQQQFMSQPCRLSLSEPLRHYPEVIGAPGSMRPLIFAAGKFFLNRFYQYEADIVKAISDRQRQSYQISNLKPELNRLFPENIIGEAPNWQKVAAIIALRNGFSIISGGPGTGKTTTVGKILALLLQQQPNMVIKLVAPTGKAADRLNGSIQQFKELNKEKIAANILATIPENAQTIHRFLGLGSRRQRYDTYNRAPVDLLIVDEASMVSLSLFAKLFNALPTDCRIILLGDKDQLMAVENGNVLRDIVGQEELNRFSPQLAEVVARLTDNGLILPQHEQCSDLSDLAVQLEYSWRFQQESGIGILAKAVNAATAATPPEELLNLFRNPALRHEIKLLELADNPTMEESEKQIEKFVNDFCHSHLQDYRNALQRCLKQRDLTSITAALDALAEFRILCAVNDGPGGVNTINTMIENYWLGQHSSSKFYHGRPIMITANDYKLQLMNGDVGIVIGDHDDMQVYFSSENGLRALNPASLGAHSTAFAISIHKSQGSEFDHIFVMLSPIMMPILSKELLYTAITRAKQQCTIIAQTEIFYRAAISRLQRQSGLSDKLST